MQIKRAGVRGYIRQTRKIEDEGGNCVIYFYLGCYFNISVAGSV